MKATKQETSPMICDDVEQAYLARRFVCPSCGHATARPVDVTGDDLACTDTETCGWTGTLDDAVELDT